MLHLIASALNELVEEVSIPDIDKLVKQETHFDRVGLSLTEKHLYSCHNIFVVDNYIDEDYDILIQDLDLVVQFKLDYCPNNLDWIIRRVYNINFVQAPCLIIRKSRLSSLVLPQVSLSEDAEPSLAGKLARLNVPTSLFCERLAKEDCCEDVWDRFIHGDLNMVTIQFKSVNDLYVATPLTNCQSSLPIIESFTFDLTA